MSLFLIEDPEAEVITIEKVQVGSRRLCGIWNRHDERKRVFCPAGHPSRRSQVGVRAIFPPHTDAILG